MSFVRRSLERDSSNRFGTDSDIQKLYPNFRNKDNGPQDPWIDWAPLEDADPKKAKHDGAAIRIYHRMKNSGHAIMSNERYYGSNIIIQSPFIREALADDFQRQGLVFNSKGYAESQAPHMALFFCRDRIAEVMKASEGTLQAHCEKLDEVIQEYLSEALDAHELYEKEQTIAYPFLWILFPRGKIFAIRKIWGSFGGYRVRSVVSLNQRWVIHSEVIRFGGTYYGRAYARFTLLISDSVSAVASRLRLSELNPWIVDLARDPELRGRLSDRGRKILQYQVPGYVQYTQNVDPSSWAPPLTDGERLVVDTFMYCAATRLFFKRLAAYEKLPTREKVDNAHQEGVSGHVEGESEDEDEGHDKTYTRPTPQDVQKNIDVMCSNDDNLVICAPFVFAYSLRRGYWSQVVVENLEKVRPSEDSFKKLIFDEHKKEILQKLTRRFVASRRPYDDLIPDKGNSFLVLLSGAPGTGKTLMAESLSDYLGRPLLRIMANHKNPFWGRSRTEGSHASLPAIAATVAQAATSAANAATLAGKEVGMRDEFEAKVQMAAEWDGIVLFDEANFVIENSSTTIASNMSVFLRYIEYFKGIVFLTTNASQSSINTALRSRTHIHFIFQELSATMRAQVWQNFVDRAPDTARGLDDDALRKLSQWRVNGRDIKNIFNMARVLCEEKGIQMTFEAIEEFIPAVQPLAVKEGNEEILI